MSSQASLDEKMRDQMEDEGDEQEVMALDKGTQHTEEQFYFYFLPHKLSLPGSLTINPFANRLLAFHRETTVPAYYTLKINPCLCLFVCLLIDVDIIQRVSILFNSFNNPVQSIPGT